MNLKLPHGNKCHIKLDTRDNIRCDLFSRCLSASFKFQNTIILSFAFVTMNRKTFRCTHMFHKASRPIDAE
jgi:hypothetical protein